MLSKVLLELCKNKDLSPVLGFKWWTCAMFFYDLPRLSVDLDFDFLWKDHKKIIPIIKKILENFGKISDFEDKFYTLFYELNYGFGERNMKIEIRKKWLFWEFTTRNFMWENILIMKESDLFTNKLIALLHRKTVTNRDIFDTRFFLQKWVQINEKIFIDQIQKTTKEYLQKIYEFIKNYDFWKILYWLWELVDNEQKNLQRQKWKIRFYDF